MAKQMSFVELFNCLAKYIDKPLTRFKYCLRVKRGLTDTSKKGGLYKDCRYLEGAVKILTLRNSLDFRKLYCGKVSLIDYGRKALMK